MSLKKFWLKHMLVDISVQFKITAENGKREVHA